MDTEQLLPTTHSSKLNCVSVNNLEKASGKKNFEIRLDRQVCLCYSLPINLRNSAGDSSARILETASRLFYEQGYNATGINQIIAEAEVAKASFYHHFHSKEELCVAYLRKRHQDWFSWLWREIEQHESAQERLLSLFTFLEQWLPNCNFRGCAFLNIASEVAPVEEICLMPWKCKSQSQPRCFDGSIKIILGMFISPLMRQIFPSFIARRMVVLVLTSIKTIFPSLM